MSEADYLVGREEYELSFVGDVLDEDPVDSQTVYKETIGMSERAIAAAAAYRTTSGGGGGGGAPSGPAGGDLAGTYPNPTLAADYATQVELDAHVNDAAAAHAATAVAFIPAGTIAATTVQAAIEEVASEAIGGSGLFPEEAAVRFVAGTGVGLTGSDSNNGFGPSDAFATIQAAYDSLPDTAGSDHGGGTIFLLPGYHDVGTGFVGNGLQKHAVIQSMSGFNPWFSAVARDTTVPLGYVTVYTSQSAEALFEWGNTTGTNQEGWVVRGIGFDMTDTDTLYGIYAEDVNYARVMDCMFEGGVEVGGLDRQAIRAFVDDGSDSSWWRVERNRTKIVGLANFGINTKNCNHNIFAYNICALGASNRGIVLEDAHRCMTLYNTMEGGPAPGIEATDCRYCRFIGDAPEGGNPFDPFINVLGGSDNVIDPNASVDGTSPVINDTAATNLYPSLKNPIRNNQTASYTLVPSDMGKIIRMNVATANNLTVPNSSTAMFPNGTTIYVNQRGAGQTTLVAAGGVTIRSSGGLLNLIGQYAACTLQYMGGNEWQAWGNLA